MLPIQALQRHEKPVQAMAVWHDTVFTGSEDEEIKVMTLSNIYYYTGFVSSYRFLNISNYKKSYIFEWNCVLFIVLLLNREVFHH